MVRVYQRIKMAPQPFWSPELTHLFKLWQQDMRHGLTPYTPATAENCERRFILYTRRQFEGKENCLTVEHIFDLTHVYAALTAIAIESYSTRHNMLCSILSFAKFLIKLERLDDSILDKLRKFRPRRVIPPRKTVLRDTIEIEKLRDAVRTKPYEAEYSRLLDRVLVETFINTGLRVSELCRLNLEDVDLMNRVIHVNLGKGRKNRKVGITNDLHKYLSGYLTVRQKRLLLKSNPNDEAFFINRRGYRVTPSNITKRMMKLACHAGIDITPHGLRRTFATIHANNGRPLNMIQLALGHSDIRTTQEYLMTDQNQVIQAMQDW